MYRRDSVTLVETDLCQYCNCSTVSKRSIRTCRTTTATRRWYSPLRQVSELYVLFDGRNDMKLYIQFTCKARRTSLDRRCALRFTVDDFMAVRRRCVTWVSLLFTGQRISNYRSFFLSSNHLPAYCLKQKASLIVDFGDLRKWTVVFLYRAWYSFSLHVAMYW